LVNGYHLDKEKLAFTFFEGDEEVPTDQETKKIILEEGILQKSIIALGREDNFWGPVGKSGPCGPTMEIYYEMSAEHHSPRSENDLNQRFVEIWNLVFMEYYKNEKGDYEKLNQTISSMTKASNNKKCCMPSRNYRRITCNARRPSRLRFYNWWSCY